MPPSTSLLLVVVVAVGRAAAGTQGCGKTGLRTLQEGDAIYSQAKSFPSMCSLFTEVQGQRIFIGGASLVQSNQLVTLATLVAGLREEQAVEEVDQTLAASFDVRGVVDGADDECEAGLAGRSTDRPLFALCGAVDLQARGALDNTEESRVARIILHPDYSATRLTDDIAVLLTETPFNYTEHISQVCLPKPGLKAAGDKSGFERCVAVGHGLDGLDDIEGFSTYSPKLSQVVVPLWNSVACQDSLNSQHFEPSHNITWRISPSHLCAGGEEARDTCKGDGGGPLLCPDTGEQEQQERQEQGQEQEVVVGDISPLPSEDYSDELDLDLRQGGGRGGLRLVQRGVTAWGVGCGTEGRPSVYTDIAAAACWLDQVMSCHQPAGEDSGVDLRQGSRPLSVGRLNEAQCARWLGEQAAELAACGCRQQLLPTPATQEAEFDLRQSSFDLRTLDE